MKSIKVKLMVIVSSLVIILLLIQGVVSITFTKNQLEDSAKYAMEAEAYELLSMLDILEENVDLLEKQLLSDYDKNIKNQVENAISILDYYYKQYKNGVLTEEEAKRQAKEALRNVRYGKNGYFWIDNADYKLILHPITPEKEGMDRRNLKDSTGKEFMKELIEGAIKNGEAYVDFYFPKPGEKKDSPKRGYTQLFEPWQWIVGTGNYIDDIEKEIEKASNEAKDYLQKRIEENSTNGTIGVLDEYGRFLYYTKKELVGQRIDLKDIKTGEDVIQKILNTRDSFINYTIKDPVTEEIKTRICYVKYDEDKNRFIMVTQNSDVVFAGVKKVTKILILLLLGVTLITLIGSYLLANSFTKPIIELREISQKVSRGDFTVTAKVNSKDEIGALGQAFNDMITNIKTLVNEVKTSSKIVLESSQSLADITEQTSTATNEVARTIDEIAKSASEQANDTENGAVQVNELADRIENVTHSTKNVSGIAKETNKLSEKGLNTVKLLTQKAEETNKSTIKVNEIIQEVEKSSEEIGAITETIGQIAEQTNLLALNAAIEAARAGEAGKGFAVVAEEVRKLAEESASAANKVKELIIDIQNQSKTAVEAVKESSVIVQEQDMAVKETENIFNDISNAIRALIEKIEEIEKYSIDMENKKNEIVSVIENISASAEETAAATQEVSAATEQQLASVEEVASYSQNLRSLAEKLQEAVEKFIVD